jgi:hypothetical protein
LAQSFELALRHLQRATEFRDATSVALGMLGERCNRKDMIPKLDNSCDVQRASTGLQVKKA